MICFDEHQAFYPLLASPMTFCDPGLVYKGVWMPVREAHIQCMQAFSEWKTDLKDRYRQRPLWRQKADQRWLNYSRSQWPWWLCFNMRSTFDTFNVIYYIIRSYFHLICKTFHNHGSYEEHIECTKYMFTFFYNMDLQAGITLTQTKLTLSWTDTSN